MGILSLHNICKTYSDHVAVDDVSFSVPQGSIFGLLGPNGAGKTSLIRIINQITAPDKGQVVFEGEKLSSKHTSKIGYLPEERGLYKKMKVGEQCVYLSRLKGLSRAEALSRLKMWFEKFGIENWWNKPVDELSKGMAQKVQFIVTIVHNPSLLILDEPFTGFDPINAELIKQEILELKSKGTTIIFSTHRMESVEELCDNIALINKARMILEGSVSEIRAQYKADTFRVEFTGNIIEFTNALWTNFELLESKVENGINKATIRMLGTSTANNLLQAILPVCSIISFYEIMPSINDIFIKRVKEQD